MNNRLAKKLFYLQWKQAQREVMNECIVKDAVVQNGNTQGIAETV